ncbi:unnamed protein product [Diamesa serratosioi]
MLSLSWNLFIPSLVFVSFIVFGIFKIALKIRQKFSIKVNCWFCNVNSYVPYDQRNSWDCNFCTQYNGFLDDGNYNKIISEQHYSKLNSFNSQYCQKSMKLPAANGLCEICNRNQELKIHQLANFIPTNDKYFDDEIAEYKKKLEDSYQLCLKCNRHLKRTLNRVKSNVLGSKLAQIKKGLKAIDLHFNATNVKNTKDVKWLTAICIYSIAMLALANFYRDLNVAKFNIQNLKSIINDDSHYRYLLLGYSHIVATKVTIVDLLSKLLWNFEFTTKLTQMASSETIAYLYQQLNGEVLATAAVFLNVMLFLLRSHLIRFQVVSSLLLWCFKMILSEIEFIQPNIVLIKTMLAVGLLLVSLKMIIRSKKNVEQKPIEKIINNSNSFHRIHSEVNDEDSDNDLDYSDSFSQRDFDVRSVNSVRSMRTSMYSPQSTVNTFQSRTITERDLMNRTRDFERSRYQMAPSIHNDSVKYNETFMTARNDIRSSSTFDLYNANNTQQQPINQSFSINKEMTIADRIQVQKDINRLNLDDGRMNSSSSTVKNFPMNQNPFSLDRSCCGSPAPSITSGYSKFHVVSPPRLTNSKVEKNQSWLAGGYWQVSPSKPYVEVNHVAISPLSRTSSQSSGFESQANDGSKKNSRENLVAHDDFASAFSEPIHKRKLFEQNPRSTFEFNSLGNNTLFLEKQSTFVQPNFFNTSSNFGGYRDAKRNSFYK